MPNEFDLAKSIEFNEKAEAQAVYDYTELLKIVSEMTIDENIREMVVNDISEIIADELNHQEKLHKLYTEIVGIKANED